MTDLTKHGLVPVAWRYSMPVTAIIPSWKVHLRNCQDPHLRDDGYTETALYPADQVAALVQRIERMERALREVERLADEFAFDSDEDVFRLIDRVLASLKENSDD